jgi:hypothetical protein
LTFGTGNWSTAQTITLTGLDDSDVDGNISSTVTVAVSSSHDSNYAGLSAQTVSVTTQNNDSAGVAVANFRATSGQNRITLNWDALSGADNYTIYWKTSSGITIGDSSFSGIDNTTYVHGGLDSSQTY